MIDVRFAAVVIVPSPRAVAYGPTPPMIAYTRGEGTGRCRAHRRERAEGEGFEPSTRRTTGNGFRDRRIRPLCHPSGRGMVAAATPLPGRGRERGLAAAVPRGGDDLLRGEQH